MGNIAAIVNIAEDIEKAKEIAYKVMYRWDKENLRFGDVLQEEIDKFKRGETDSK